MTIIGEIIYGLGLISTGICIGGLLRFLVQDHADRKARR